ncbi:MAG: general secretion pathway protein GspB [Pseudomonadota bacterium]
MSLILDALRKSDVERSRQQAPQSVPSASSNDSTRPNRWLLPVLALLVLNAAFLGWLALKPAAQTQPVAQHTQAAATTAVDSATRSGGQAQPIDPTPTARPDVRSLLDETIREAAQTRADSPPPERVAAPAAATSSPANTTVSSESSALALPTYADLQSRGELTLGNLDLELHVYSEQADKRMAFIDGRKVTAGSTLDGGTEVIEITRFGVILQHNAQRFVLPRD